MLLQKKEKCRRHKTDQMQTQTPFPEHVLWLNRILISELSNIYPLKKKAGIVSGQWHQPNNRLVLFLCLIMSRQI